MGLTTGTVTRGSNPATAAAGVTVSFLIGTTLKGNAVTDGSGIYSIYLVQAGTYNAKVGTAVCSPTSFNIPSGTKIQNLNYT